MSVRTSQRSVDLWSLLQTTIPIEPLPGNREEQVEAAVSGLLRSRSPRSHLPLRLVHREATDAVRAAMLGPSEVPDSLTASVVAELVRQPARYLHLAPAPDGTQRVAMIGVFTSREDLIMATLVGEVTRLGHADGFGRLELSALQLPSDVDPISATFAAESLEVLAADARDADAEHPTDGVRLRHSLWCGVSDEQRPNVRFLCLVAGLDAAFADTTWSNLVELGRSVDVMVVFAEGAGAGEEYLAATFEGRGGTVIRVEDSGPEALATARYRLHEAVARSVAEQAVAAEREEQAAHAEAAERARLKAREPTFHAKQRGAERNIKTREHDEAIGDYFVRPEVARLGDQPVPGHPLLFATQPASPGKPDAKDVLLGVTAAGRRLHLVVTRTDGKDKPMKVISAWPPDEEPHSENWQEDRLRPTAKGVFTLPPNTNWLVT